jgi:hypothetical protein
MRSGRPSEISTVVARRVKKKEDALGEALIPKRYGTWIMSIRSANQFRSIAG